MELKKVIFINEYRPTNKGVEELKNFYDKAGFKRTKRSSDFDNPDEKT